MDVLKKLWRRSREESGAELIELALVVPLLLLMCGAIVDFGILFRGWETVTNAAREGARVGSLPGYSAADVEARVDLYMAAAGIPDGYTVDVSDQAIAMGAGTMTARGVTVSLTHEFLVLTPLSALFGGGIGEIDVAANAVMRAEAQALGGP